MTTLCPNCERLAIAETARRSASMRAAILECDQGHRFQLRFLTPAAVSYGAPTRGNGKLWSTNEDGSRPALVTPETGSLATNDREGVV